MDGGGWLGVVDFRRSRPGTRRRWLQARNDAVNSLCYAANEVGEVILIIIHQQQQHIIIIIIIISS
jgi:hypothetical protein